MMKLAPKLIPYQKAIIVITVLWLGFALVRETVSFIYSPLLQVEDRVTIFAFSISITLIGTGMPLLVALWLCWKTGHRVKHDEARPSTYEAVRIELDGNAGIALFFLVLFFPICLFMEHEGAFSVIPLTTPVCGMLAAFIGLRFFRRMQTDSRLTLLSVLMCSILATEYLDWNPRKSLLRNLFQIRVGMTVGEAEEIMNRHNEGFGLQDDIDRDSRDEDSSLVYISGPGGAYNADIASIRIKDGRVEAVKFSHD